MDAMQKMIDDTFEKCNVHKSDSASTLHDVIGVTVICRVNIISRSATGRTKRNHMRVTWKLNGKNVKATEVEKIVS